MAESNGKAGARVLGLPSSIPVDVQRAFRALHQYVGEVHGIVQEQGYKLNTRVGNDPQSMLRVAEFVRKELQATGKYPLTVAQLPGAGGGSKGSKTGAATTTAFVAGNTGDFAEIGSAILTITGGSGAVIGDGVTVQVTKADTTHDGYLAGADWTTFNNKQNALGFMPLNPANNLSELVSKPTARTNLGLATVAASADYNDLINKPTIPAAQVNSDWSAVSGVAQILNKPTLGTAAAGNTGNLTEATSAVLTITGGTGATIGNVTVQVKAASGTQAGYLSSADWTTFNNKQAALTLPLAIGSGGTGQTTAAAALTALGGASLTASNTISGANSFTNAVMSIGAANPTGGAELRFSDNANNRWTQFGIMRSESAPYAAWNAYQSGAGASDQWTQNVGTQISSLVEIGGVATSLLRVFGAPTSSAANTRSAFWGNALFSVNANGNVLIGTATDDGSTKLQVAGTASFTGLVTHTASIVITQASAANDVVLSYPLKINVGTDATLGPLILGVMMKPSATGGNRWISISSGDTAGMRPLILNYNGGVSYGNVLVGTNSDSSGARLQVTGTTPLTVSSSLTPNVGVAGTLTFTGSPGSPVSGRIMWGCDGSGWTFRIAKNQGGTVSDFLTFSDLNTILAERTLTITSPLVVNQVTHPNAPTIGNVGTAGTTTYTYSVVSVDASGNRTDPSTSFSTTTGNATLDATNYNTITWTARSGAVSYDVYRTVGGATQGRIVTATTALTVNDTGLTGSGSAPTSNLTSQAVFNGLVTASNAANVVGTLSTWNSLGTGGLQLSNSSGVGRWLLRGQNTETGTGNTGYDFTINSRTDAGGPLAVVMMIMRGTGNVLIGTTTDNSNGLLQVAGVVAANSGKAASWTNNNPAVTVFDDNAGSRYGMDLGNVGSGSFRTRIFSPQDIAFSTGNSTNAGLQSVFTERVTIKNGGNILIGSTTDDGTNKLQVNGSGSFKGIHSSGFQAAPVSTAGAIEMGWDGTESVVQSYNRSGSAFAPIWIVGSPVQFFKGATEVARISSGNNFLIGSTTDNTIDKLQVTGSAIFSSTVKLTVAPVFTDQAGSRTALGLGSASTAAAGNLTEATSAVLTITGGTGAVLGSGTSIQVKQATTSQSGYLSNTDWNTFNNKQAALTLPLSIANGGTGQATAAAALTALGGASLTANNSLSGVNTFTQPVTVNASSAAGLLLLTSATAVNAFVTVSGYAGTSRGLAIKTGANYRWVLAANQTAESGSNAGSDFQIESYDDSGAFLGAALLITRSTFAATFSRSVTVTSNAAVWALTIQGVNSSNSGVQFINTTASVGRNYTLYSGNDGTFRLDDNTSATNRIMVQTNGEVTFSNRIRFPATYGDMNDGAIGAGLFAPGLNIVGDNTDNIARKIAIWGGVTQMYNGTGNTWSGLNTFSNPDQIVFGSNWLSWTPTWTPGAGMTISVLSYQAQYIRIGALIFFHLEWTSTFGGTVTYSVFPSLPVAAAGTGAAFLYQCAGIMNDSAGHYVPLIAWIGQSDASHMNVAQATTPTGGLTPWAIGVNYNFYISGFYRCA